MNVKSPRMLKLVGVAGLVVLVFLSWAFVLSPRLNKAGEIRDEADRVALNNKSLTKAIEGLKVKEANLDQERAQAAALAARMPADAAQPELFAAIRAAASRAGIDESSLSSVVPSVPQWRAGIGASAGRAAPGALATMTLDITISGTYAQMSRFINELEAIPRSYLMNTVTLTPVATTADRYTMAMSGMMFVMAPPADPKAAPSTAASTAPAAAPSTAPSN